MKIERTQCGQDRKYGDFYYKYKIETDKELKIEEIFEEINKQFYSNHTTAIPSGQWREEDTNSTNHFRNYYDLEKASYGYFLTVTSPSTH